MKGEVCSSLPLVPTLDTQRELGPEQQEFSLCPSADTNGLPYSPNLMSPAFSPGLLKIFLEVSQAFLG